VEAVLRCIPKVVTEFLEPTATRNGYNYNNETLIELLEISKQEQQYMKTIIGQQEKYDVIIRVAEKHEEMKMG